MLRFFKFLLLVLLVPVFLLICVFWAPPQLLARLAEHGAERFANTDFKLAQLDVAWFDKGPGVALESFALPDSLLEGKSAQVVVDVSELFHAQLVLDHVELRDADLELVRDEEGLWNWQQLLASKPETEPSTENGNESTTSPSIPLARHIEVANVRITVDDAVLERQGTVTVNITGSTTDPERPTQLLADGELDGVPLNLDLSVNPLAELSSSLDDLALTASANVGDVALVLEGTIGNPSALSDLDLTFTAEAPDLQDAEALAGIMMPTLPPWRVEGEVKRDGNYWVLQKFAGKVGDSDIQGDVRVDPTTSPLTAYANLISNTLDLDDFAGLLGGVPDPDESATAEQQKVAEKRETDDRLLPDEPIALAALTEYFNGAVEYRAEAVRSPLWPIESMDTRIVVNAGKADITRLKVDVAEGHIDGTARLDATRQPSAGEFELEVNAVNLREVMSALGIDNDSFGNIGGNVRFWFEGDSIADMAASLDGGMFLLMTEGKLDALLIELAGIDLVESLFLALDPDKTLSTIDCAYLDLQADDGVADISRLVVDSNDTVFVGDGQIDMNDESLDIAIAPHPKDLSILSAQTSVRVRGTVGDMQVVPGKELFLRTAAAAVLGTVAAPIAALLPLVQTGEGEDSAYCSGLVDALDDATEMEQ